MLSSHDGPLSGTSAVDGTLPYRPDCHLRPGCFHLPVLIDALVLMFELTISVLKPAITLPIFRAS